MYDSIIIGCGPSGMTAAIYLARANKKVLILEKETIGGQMSSSPLIENYPGYESISGSELSNNMFNQMMDLGVQMELEEVTKIVDGKVKKVVTTDNTYETKTIIIASGAKHRMLGLENEENLVGKGIHFCVSCDGAFYKEKTVAVIGGGNSAIINAITLAEICKKVYVIQNLDDLTCEEVLSRKIRNKDNVEIFCSSSVNNIIGDNELESITIKTKDKLKKIKIDGMFLSIGFLPQSEIFKELIDIDKYNYIDSQNCLTNKKGIYVGGDVRVKSFRQITTAVSDGAVCANEVIKYLN